MLVILGGCLVEVLSGFSLVIYFHPPGVVPGCKGVHRGDPCPLLEERHYGGHTLQPCHMLGQWTLRPQIGGFRCLPPPGPPTIHHPEGSRHKRVCGARKKSPQEETETLVAAFPVSLLSGVEWKRLFPEKAPTMNGERKRTCTAAHFCPHPPACPLPDL